jgi:hypothetical protein
MDTTELWQSLAKTDPHLHQVFLQHSTDPRLHQVVENPNSLAQFLQGARSVMRPESLGQIFATIVTSLILKHGIIRGLRAYREYRLKPSDPASLSSTSDQWPETASHLAVVVVVYDRHGNPLPLVQNDHISPVLNTIWTELVNILAPKLSQMTPQLTESTYGALSVGHIPWQDIPYDNDQLEHILINSLKSLQWIPGESSTPWVYFTSRPLPTSSASISILPELIINIMWTA